MDFRLPEDVPLDIPIEMDCEKVDSLFYSGN